MVRKYTATAAVSKAPLILTIWMEESAQQHFNGLRSLYFPPERNHLDAHLTLFHALPDERYIVREVIEAAQMQNIFEIEAESIVSIGKGTAVKTAAPELMSLHRTLQAKWSVLLTDQDKQKLWPHVTIQNKVMPDEAKKLQDMLGAIFQPFHFTACGVQLWRYLGGPWQAVAGIKFQNNGV
jgi:hypothetical protein